MPQEALQKCLKHFKLTLEKESKHLGLHFEALPEMSAPSSRAQGGCSVLLHPTGLGFAPPWGGGEERSRQATRDLPCARLSSETSRCQEHAGVDAFAAPRKCSRLQAGEKCHSLQPGTLPPKAAGLFFQAGAPLVKSCIVVRALGQAQVQFPSLPERIQTRISHKSALTTRL